jgi:hypothetical protein
MASKHGSRKKLAKLLVEAVDEVPSCIVESAKRSLVHFWIREGLNG